MKDSKDTIMTATISALKVFCQESRWYLNPCCVWEEFQKDIHKMWSRDAVRTTPFSVSQRVHQGTNLLEKGHWARQEECTKVYPYKEMVFARAQNGCLWLIKDPARMLLGSRMEVEKGVLKIIPSLGLRGGSCQGIWSRCGDTLWERMSEEVHSHH